MVTQNRQGPNYLKLLLLIGNVASEEICNYGQTQIPEKLFSHLIGWSCFEHVGYNNTYSEIYACVSNEGYKVPCLKNGNTYLDFSSHASRIKLLPFSNKSHDLLSCFEQKTTCQLTPSSNSITKVWIPASVCDTEPRNKFHIAMLSISFIIGIPAVFLLFYFTWKDKTDILLILHRNLICALTIRSLMSLLIQSEIILPKYEGSTYNKDGIPALATFENLFLNLVLGFWTVQSITLWKMITNERQLPLRVDIYTYASIGLSLSFTLIWVIVMASTRDLDGWIGIRSWTQWINDPLRIIFLAFQICLIGYCAKIMFGLKSDDAKNGRRIRIELLYILLLTPFFFLQFCLNAATPTGVDCAEAFFFVLYFIDGLQGTLVCLFFFFLDSEVKKRFTTLLGLDAKKTDPVRTITTLDMLREQGTTDVVYSSVVDSDRHARLLQVYQKQNLIPMPSVTIVEGEEFLTCQPVRKVSTTTLYFDAVSQPEEPTTPVLESKYSSVGQSISSTSSEEDMQGYCDMETLKRGSKRVPEIVITEELPSKEVNEVFQDEQDLGEALDDAMDAEFAEVELRIRRHSESSSSRYSTFNLSESEDEDDLALHKVRSKQKIESLERVPDSVQKIEMHHDNNWKLPRKIPPRALEKAEDVQEDSPISEDIMNLLLSRNWDSEVINSDLEDPEREPERPSEDIRRCTPKDDHSSSDSSEVYTPRTSKVPEFIRRRRATSETEVERSPEVIPRNRHSDDENSTESENLPEDIKQCKVVDDPSTSDSSDTITNVESLQEIPLPRRVSDDDHSSNSSDMEVEVGSSPEVLLKDTADQSKSDSCNDTPQTWKKIHEQSPKVILSQIRITDDGHSTKFESLPEVVPRKRGSETNIPDQGLLEITLPKRFSDDEHSSNSSDMEVEVGSCPGVLLRGTADQSTSDSSDDTPRTSKTTVSDDAQSNTETKVESLPEVVPRKRGSETNIPDQSHPETTPPKRVSSSDSSDTEVEAGTSPKVIWSKSSPSGDDIFKSPTDPKDWYNTEPSRTNSCEIEEKVESSDENSSDSSDTETSKNSDRIPEAVMSLLLTRSTDADSDIEDHELPSVPMGTSEPVSSSGDEFGVQEQAPGAIVEEPDRDLRSNPLLRHAHTLPRGTEPVPQPRPRSIAENRREEFSKMFSNHRDKVLSDSANKIRRFQVLQDLHRGTTNADEWQPQNIHFSDG